MDESSKDRYIAAVQANKGTASAHYLRYISLILVGFTILAIGGAVFFVTASLSDEQAFAAVVLIASGLIAIVMWLYAYDSFSKGNSNLTYEPDIER
jgi:hypothetical protein